MSGCHYPLKSPCDFLKDEEFDMVIDLFDLLLLAFWDFVLETYRWHGSLFHVSFVYCHVEVFASDRSLVQRSPTECGVSECDRESSVMWGLSRVGGKQMTHSVAGVLIFRNESHKYTCLKQILPFCRQNECRCLAFCQGRNISPF